MNKLIVMFLIVLAISSQQALAIPLATDGLVSITRQVSVEGPGFWGRAKNQWEAQSFADAQKRMYDSPNEKGFFDYFWAVIILGGAAFILGNGFLTLGQKARKNLLLGAGAIGLIVGVMALKNKSDLDAFRKEQLAMEERREREKAEIENGYKNSDKVRLLLSGNAFGNMKGANNLVEIRKIYSGNSSPEHDKLTKQKYLIVSCGPKTGRACPELPKDHPMTKRLERYEMYYCNQKIVDADSIGRVIPEYEYNKYLSNFIFTGVGLSYSDSYHTSIRYDSLVGLGVGGVNVYQSYIGSREIIYGTYNDIDIFWRNGRDKDLCGNSLTS